MELPYPGLDAVTQELRAEFPTLMHGHTQATWESDLAASQTASHLVLNLAKLFMPGMIEQHTLRHAMGSDNQPALAVSSLQHELCGESLRLAGLILSRLPCFGATAGEGWRLVPRLHNLQRAIQVCCHHRFTTALLKAARKRRINYQLVSAEDRLYLIGRGCHSLLINSSQSNRDSVIGSALCQHKGKTNRFLRQLGLPVPPQIQLSNSRQWPIARDAVGYPCVAKPVNLDRGEGVTANITSDSELQAAVERAFKACRAGVVVERQIPGDDFRIVMTNSHIIYAVKRVPPSIIGDGLSSVTELIEAANHTRRKLHEEDGVTGTIEIDAEVQQHLSQARITLNDILAAGRQVRLRTKANVSAGGLFQEFTDGIHPDTQALCQSIAQSLHLDSLGIDYITPDISQSPTNCPGAVIEVNTMPQITPHWAERWLEEHIPSDWAHDCPTTILITSALNNPDGITDEDAETILDLLRQHDSVNSDHTVLAIPLRIGSAVTAVINKKLRRLLDKAPAITIYSNPSQVYLNRSHERIIFLIGDNDVLESGLPTAYPDYIILALDSKTRTRPEWKHFIAELSSHTPIAETTASLDKGSVR